MKKSTLYLYICPIALLILQGITLKAQANFQIESAAGISLLDVREDGVLLPKLSTAERLAKAATLTPSENGLLVFDSESNSFFVWKSPNWVEIGTDSDPNNEIQNLTSVLTQSNDAGASKISNLADPTLAQDAATKGYVDVLEQRISDLEAYINTLFPPIPSIEFNGKTWLAQNLNIEVANSWCYNNDPANCEQYGRLYNLQAAIVGCTQLGQGWRLPTPQDWNDLIIFLGGYNSQTYADMVDGGSSGFNAKLGGEFDPGDNIFRYLGSRGYYWRNTQTANSNFTFFINSNVSSLSNPVFSRGASVRCIKD